MPLPSPRWGGPEFRDLRARINAAITPAAPSISPKISSNVMALLLPFELLAHALLHGSEMQGVCQSPRAVSATFSAGETTRCVESRECRS